jgi:hypothetical protein
MPITFQNVTITGGLQLVSEGAAPPSGDPDWANVSLLLNTTSTNAQTNNTFLDSSAAGLTITRFGSPTQGSITPFTVANGTSYSTATNGGSSSLAGGGQYLKSVASAGLSFNGDFTIECWVKTTTISLDPYGRRIWSFGSAGTAAEIDLDFYNGSAITTNACVSVGNVGAVIVGTIAVADGNWHHVAVTRSGSSIKLFVDGVQSGSTYTSSATFSAGATNGMYVGSLGSVGGYFVGNISSLRVVKGTAVYTSAFTPPTAPLTAISGTSLLLNYTNAGMYDAATKNNMTSVGSAQVSTTQAKWSPTSLRIAGGTDVLTMPSSSNFNVGSSDFTLEAWIYVSAYVSSSAIFGNGSGFSPFLIFIGASSEITFYSSTNGSTWAISDLRFATNPATGTWHHVAVTRSGTTFRTFFNGTLANSTTLSGALYNNPSDVTIGRYTNSFNGYIQDLRLTKGVARYTASFTPPTAAFPTF